MAVAPGLSHWIPLPYGPLRAFVRDPLGFQLRAWERFGDVFRFRIGPLLVHFLYHPDHVRRVLHDNQKNYLRGWQFRLLRRLLGNNLVVSEGDFWRRQRRLAQPAFHRQRLARYAEVMVDATCQLVSRWREAAAARKPVDIAPEMSRLALAIASRTLFDRDISDEANAVGRAFAVGATYLEQRFNNPFTSLPVWVPTPGNRRFRRAVHTLNDIVAALIRERRRDERDHGDLLSMLIQAQDVETGLAMTDDQVRSEVLTFLLAGHETTATALTWTAYLLARHPAIQARLRDEIVAAIGDGVPSVADVPHLEATTMVLEEALRLYPPIWVVPRQTVSDDEIGGFRIPARSTVALCPFITHRHPAAWEKPTVFDPDRFVADRAARLPKGAYFPFLSGPHQCIGGDFAMLEMRLVLALVFRQFHLTLFSDEGIQPKGSLALRPSKPVLVLLRNVW
jgi:cytochrome P450